MKAGLRQRAKRVNKVFYLRDEIECGKLLILATGVAAGTGGEDFTKLIAL
jgi:hypothetical protein